MIHIQQKLVASFSYTFNPDVFFYILKQKDLIKAGPIHAMAVLGGGGEV
jgi:hypothetical protein